MRVGDVTILRAPIASDGTSRREAERAAVGALLRAHFGTEVTVGHRADGSPYLEGRGELISVSHCRDEVVVAIASAGHPSFGIDVETWRDQLEHVRGRFVTPEECNWVGNSRGRLLQAWTVKEAVYKAAGTPGLALLDIAILPGASSPCAAAAGRRFNLYFLQSEDTRALTLAVER